MDIPQRGKHQFVYSIMRLRDMLKCTHVQGEQREGTQWQIFTDEQITQLSGNQNVQWVSRTGVQFTPEFKLLAWEQKKQGRRMKDIFRDNEINQNVWAESDLRISPSGWMTQCRRAESLPDRRIYNSRPAGPPRKRSPLRSVSAGSSMNWSMQSRKSSS